MPKAYHKNVPGPFYVEDRCCLTCGIWEDEAPGLIAFEDLGPPPDDPTWLHYYHCYVKKQPETEAEFEQMISVMRVADLDCFRFRGGEGSRRTRLLEEGFAAQCDALTDGEKNDQ